MKKRTVDGIEVEISSGNVFADMEQIGEEGVRWTVKVSKDTDVSLRSFLAQRGMKKGDLSKFIERAVQKEAVQTPASRRVRHAENDLTLVQTAIRDP